MQPIDLFIIGAQKAGTTALHKLLSAHPQISMAPAKELHFFDNEERDWTTTEYSDLAHVLPAGDLPVRGEATPIYSYWPNAIQRIKLLAPDSKLIMLLRHPVHRAYSHWKMEVARAQEPMSFEMATGAEGRRRIEKRGTKADRVFSYVERGFYSWQIKNLYDHFPKENVLLLLTDSLWEDQPSTIANIERFLGLKSGGLVAREYTVMANTDIGQTISPDTYRTLLNLYNADILETAEVSGFDLSHWLAADYREAVYA